MAGEIKNPKIEIDYQNFENLCVMQCSKTEICGFFKISEDTLERRLRERYGMTFTEVFEIFSQPGKISLRREQFKLANKGDRVMLIWLGKQYLGQTDKNVSDINLKDTKFELKIVPDSGEEPLPISDMTGDETIKEVIADGIPGATAPAQSAEIE